MEAGKIKTCTVSFLLACTFIAAGGLCFYIEAAPDELNAPAVKLQQRINPNTATVSSLMRLPRIGRTRAAAIVGYRQTVSQKAFEDCKDLQKVKGIGMVTSRDMCDYLRFD